MSLAESICKLIKQREEFGAKRYGRPLCPTNDKRDFLQEAIEEWADQGFYLMAEMEKRQASQAKARVRQERYNHSPKGAARRIKFNRSQKGKARTARSNVSAKGIARHERYNSKPSTKERAVWRMRSWRKLQSIQNAIR